MLYSYKVPLYKKKTLTVSCMLLCESGDRVKADQSSFSADLHAVMLRHHCSEYESIQFVSTAINLSLSFRFNSIKSSMNLAQYLSHLDLYTSTHNLILHTLIMISQVYKCYR